MPTFVYEFAVQETIFAEYMITSQNNNSIAVTVDLGLLSRALKSSVNMDGDQLVVKLVKKGSSTSQNKLPYLTFESKVRHTFLNFQPDDAAFLVCLGSHAADP